MSASSSAITTERAAGDADTDAASPAGVTGGGGVGSPFGTGAADFVTGGLDARVGRGAFGADSVIGSLRPSGSSSTTRTRGRCARTHLSCRPDDIGPGPRSMLTQKCFGSVSGIRTAAIDVDVRRRPGPT